MTDILLNNRCPACDAAPFDGVMHRVWGLRTPQGQTMVYEASCVHCQQTVHVAQDGLRVAPRGAGSAQGQVTIADDFDAPLADFDEYM